jgi:D-amino peptidase
LYVAIHSGSGTPNAFFPHTHSGVFAEVRINGKTACEMDVYGGFLGEFSVPIGFVSGEDIAVKQALEALPWAKSVVVDKQEETYTSGEKSLSFLREGRKHLRETAMQSVRQAGVMKPLVVSGPLHFEVKFRTEELAGRLNTWGLQMKGNSVQWTSENMIGGLETLNKLAFFPKNFYPFRRPALFLMRQYFRMKHSYFAPRPNREDTVNFSQ